MKVQNKGRINPVKICFVSSSGGHLEELLSLRPLMNKYDSFILTEKTPFSPSLDGVRTYYMKQVNRKEIGFIPYMIYNLVQSIRVYIIEKPDVVISTGVLAVIPICLYTKMRKGRVIFIETFANTASPTKTGKFVYRFADRFYVYWESMLAFYPDAICIH